MRSMLTFSEKTRLIIESFLSAFLLFDFVYLLIGVINGGQTGTGGIIMLVSAILFGIGGVIATIRTAIRFTRYRRSRKGG